MKILVVGIVTNGQVVRVREEAEKRGHSLDACYTSDLVIEADSESFVPTLRGKLMDGYDLIYLWTVGKRRWEWYTTCLYLYKKYGTIIVNTKTIDPTYNYYLSPAVDYLRQTESDIAYPRSLLVFSSKKLETMLGGFTFPLIVKVPDGRQGRGVHKAENLEELKKIVDEITAEGGQSAVIREFIPNDGDVRVFTVGYKAIGAMKRTPKVGDFRSNISQGGSGAVFDLEASPEVREIAERASKVTRTEIAGVDVILHKETGKAYILEVNPGPQFTGFEQYTKVNAAGKIIEYFEQLLQEKKH